MRFAHSFAYTFSKAPSRIPEIKPVSPGPARYGSINLDRYKRKEPTWRIGKAKKFITSKNINPGPERYTPIVKEKHTAPCYSFASKPLAASLDEEHEE